MGDVNDKTIIKNHILSLPLSIKEKKQSKGTAAIKLRSTNSINLRILVLCRLLCDHSNYVFVFKKEQRKATLAYPYFPISKIYDGDMNILFNDDDIKLTGNAKTKYCRAFIHEFLRKHLEGTDFTFGIVKTKSAMKRSEYDAVEIQKIVSFARRSTKKDYNMKVMEETLGLNTLTLLKNKFNESVHPKLLVAHSTNLKNNPNILLNLDENLLNLEFDGINLERYTEDPSPRSSNNTYSFDNPMRITPNGHNLKSHIPSSVLMSGPLRNDSVKSSGPLYNEIGLSSLYRENVKSSGSLYNENVKFLHNFGNEDVKSSHDFGNEDVKSSHNFGNEIGLSSRNFGNEDVKSHNFGNEIGFSSLYNKSDLSSSTLNQNKISSSIPIDRRYDSTNKKVNEDHYSKSKHLQHNEYFPQRLTSDGYKTYKEFSISNDFVDHPGGESGFPISRKLFMKEYTYDGTTHVLI
ncbi:hypothetical protein QTN25_005030 [Entamoeba marina]